MPIKIENLIKEKKRIIHDILFENIMPNAGDIYWGLDMLLAEIRKNNIDEHLHINKFEIKKMISDLANKRKDITMYIINNNLYFKFNP